MIDGNTKVMGVIGNPIRHTKSPQIHNEIARLMDHNLAYLPFEVKNDLAAAIKGAYHLGVIGMNVTVPYKSDVIPLLCEIDEQAKKIGAVNTLVRKEHGYKGYNTDVIGLKRELDEAKIPLENQDVIIIGAGGAARAAAFMCASLGVRHIMILNRNPKHAKDLAEDIIQSYSLDPAHVSVGSLSDDFSWMTHSDYLAIQCTNVGLYPKSDEVIIEQEEFYQHLSYAVDLIYTPKETIFMQMAKRAGAKSYNGSRMLLYQAVAAYELCNDVKVPNEAIEQLYQFVFGDQSNFVLIGFMGAGKTTVGKRLAELLHSRFADTDELIEEQEGLKISEIFEQYGEAYFRDLETNLLKKINREYTGVVLSVGGGMPIAERNHMYLKNIGKVIYLKTDAESVRQRLQHDHNRPLLQGHDVKRRITDLMELRNPIYEKLADLMIDTNDRNVEEIVTDIINEMR
ncbi:MAG: shikimate dehydrogenase [Clostridia bacterium]|nr:shikimate dehydrogenase [Clostridia bacterium]